MLLIAGSIRRATAVSNRRLRRLIQLELGLELADNATGGSYNSDVMFLNLVRAPGILIYSGSQPNHRYSALPLRRKSSTPTPRGGINAE